MTAALVLPAGAAHAAATNDVAIGATGGYVSVNVLANDAAAAGDYVLLAPGAPSAFFVEGNDTIGVDLASATAPDTLTATYRRYDATDTLVDAATLTVYVVGQASTHTPGDGQVVIDWPKRPAGVTDLKISYSTVGSLYSHTSSRAHTTVTKTAPATITGLANGMQTYFYVTPVAGTTESVFGDSFSFSPRANNAPPVAVDDTESFNGTAPLSFSPLVNDTDADGDDVTITGNSGLSPASAGSLNCGTYTCAFQPAAGAPDASFTYTISDGYGGSATATVHLLARHVTAVADSVSFPADEDVAVNLLGNDLGVRADDYVGVQVNGVTGYHSGGKTYLRAAVAGTFTGTYQVLAANGTALATGDITVTATARRALAAFDDDDTTDIGVATVAAVSMNDRIPTDGFPISTDPAKTKITNAPNHGTAVVDFSPQDYAHDGVLRNLPRIRYTPAAGFHGIDTVGYQITDAQGRSASATLTVEVSPWGAGPHGVDAQAGIGEATINWGLTSSPAIDRLKLCYAVAGTRAGSPAAPTMPCAHEWPLTGVPLSTHVTGLTNDRDYVATLFVHYNDGTADGVWSPGTTSWFRPGVQSSYGTWLETSGTTAKLTWANPTGATGTTIGWSTTSAPQELGTGPTWTTVGAGVTEATITGLTPGTYYYFSVFATAPGSWADPDQADATTRATNTAPVAINDALSTNENRYKTVDVLANDSDADNDLLTIRSHTQGAHGSVSCWGVSCEYDPDPQFAGTDSFTYTISDGHFGTATATVNVTVVNVPDPPFAESFSRTVTQGVDATIDLSNHTSDPDVGDVLTYAITTQPTRGSLTCVASTGVCHYTGTSAGADSFVYKVTDSTGLTASGTASLTVVANQPPNVSGGDFNASPGVAKSINLATLATDPDQDVLTFAVTGPPAKGTLTCTSAGACTYTANAGSTGDDSFVFTASDGKAAPVTGSVTIHLQGLNHAPVVRDASLTTPNTSPLAVDLTALASDSDGDPLTYVVETQPSSGTLTCAAGHCTYTPTVGYVGTVTWRFHASDGQVNSNVGTVTIAVTSTAAANRPPTAGPDSLTVGSGVAAVVNVAANDSDADHDALVYALTSPPAHGTATCTTAGSCTYTSAVGYFGADSFTYTVTDAKGATATGTVTVTVNRPVITVTGKVAINGQPKVGKTLKALAGTVPAGATMKYQWLRGKKSIKKATKSTYKLTKADKGAVISVKITYNLPGALPVTKLVKLKKRIG